MSQAELERRAEDKTLFGFWVYLMTDCVLFGTLFATFAVLRHNTYGGASGEDLFSLPFVLKETLILLTSSFLCGLGIVSARRGYKNLVYFYFGLTFLLGALFLYLELHEFSNLYSEGNSWRRSAFLSSFFTLVGTHGAHITAGLIWMASLLARIRYTGLSASNIKRLTLLSLFWHFLDIVWIFIFTVVYLLGFVT